jgi:D-alanyl-D-alanine carboxypeptidase
VAGAISLAALAVLAAPARGAELAPADAQFVDATVAQVMQAQRLPGVTVRITGPRGTYEKSYGAGDVAADVAMSPRDHVRIASITKTYTATAILLQVRRGRLSLDDRLSEFVEGVPNGRRITVRQLLAMQAGVYDFTADPAFARRFAADPLMAFRPADILPIIRRHKPEFAPGAQTEYSDSNYVLLGMILAEVTGRSPRRVITDEIIEPLGLRETSYPRTAGLPAPFAHGYYAGPQGQGEIRELTRVNPAVPSTAGAMISTIDDLIAWGEELATGTLIGPRLQRQRLRFGAFPNPGGPPVGYGLGILRFADWVGHNGAIFGFSTVTFVDRESGAQIAVAANLSSNSTTPTMDIFAPIAAQLYPESVQAG